jgi:hypothetical protein
VPEPFSFRAPAYERFEVVSRGDLVPGLLWRNPARGRCPLVLIAPAVGSAKEAPEVEALCRALLAAQVSAAAIDLPLQGERASAKLSVRLAHCASGRPLGPADQLLWHEYLRQVALDLDATRAALARGDGVRPEAVGCVAFEPGGAAALAWAARAPDLRVCRAATAAADARELAAILRGQLS